MNTMLRPPLPADDLTIGGTAFAAGARLLIAPHLGGHAFYLTCFPLVFITAAFADFGPGLLAGVLSGLTTYPAAVPGGDWLLAKGGSNWTGLALFSILGVGMAWLSRRARRGAEQKDAAPTPSSATDAAQREHTEQLLYESEERLRLALDAGRMGTWDWDIPAGKVTWSPTLEMIHGLAPGSFAGTLEAYQEDIHPDDHQRVLDSIRQTVEKGQTHHLEYRIIVPDGSVRWLEARGKLFRDEADQPVRLIGVCSEVTERKRLEQSLRFVAQASNSLASLVDYKSTLQLVATLAVPDFADWCAVDMVRVDGAVERLAVAHVDPSKVALAEELYRRYPPDPDSSRGMMKVLRTGEPELGARIPDSVLEQAARDEEHLQILRELKLKSYLCVPLKAKQRTLGVMTFVSSDQGRIYEPEDLAVAEELAHRAAIAIENARLYQEVREADRRKDEFLAMLAHELRNPLAPLRSGLDLLAMDAGNDQKIIRLMQEQIEHLVRLVDDLLDVSRITRGKVELRRETVELSALVKRAAASARPLLESQQQQLTIAIPEQPLWLHVDPVRLVQVVGNLLNNASKYMERGGEVTLTAELQDGEVVIRVRDTGVGIEPELLPNVFDLFTQSSRSLDRAQGGMGIGLTLVKRLVEIHGGTVSAHSDGLGKGSTFEIRLPLGKAAAKTETPDKSPAVPTSRRILVVDDNVGAAWLLSKLLTKVGDHDVEMAHDGPSALAQIKERHPDIVLLDIGLPGMDGYEVGRAVREMPGFADVLLVALTGYGQEEDRRRSKIAGFDEHLTKPPSVAQMRAVLAHPKLNKGGGDEPA